MKVLATLTTVATLLVPSIAAACPMHSDHVTNMSCAAGQVYDEEARTCVPQTS